MLFTMSVLPPAAFPGFTTAEGDAVQASYLEVKYMEKRRANHRRLRPTWTQRSLRTSGRSVLLVVPFLDILYQHRLR